jgi:predicted DsbA family dithiol-disulfide isomerase
LKQEFDIEDEWVSFEIHPDTPQHGMPLVDLFPASAIDQMHSRLVQSGAQYGLTFVNNPLLSNSRLALSASEFARDHGAFRSYHRRLFQAYFSESQDIGDMEVLLNIAKACGLDANELAAALTMDAYAERLQRSQQEGHQLGVNGTPTLIINDRYRVVGAQPLVAMRKALREIR